jgi:hypothetical protein
MNCRSLVLIFALSAFGVPVLTGTPVAPYAGRQTRTIKALSPADVAIAKDRSFRFVEYLADLGRETGKIEGLYDQLNARVESTLMDYRILRITSREKDFQIVSELSSLVCYLSAIEWSRQTDICK